MESFDRRIETLLDGELIEENRKDLRRFNSEKAVGGMATGI